MIQKAFILLVLFVLSDTILFAQVFKKSDFIQISKNVFLSKFEVTNESYNNFIVEYEGLYEDSIQIFNKLWMKPGFDKSYYEAYAMLYANNISYRNHPVVNVSQFAAKEYCNWLNQNIIDSPLPADSIVFRLPTKREWKAVYKKLNKKLNIENEKLTQPADTIPMTQEKLDFLAKEYIKEIQDPETFNAKMDYYNSEEFIEGFLIYPVDFSIAESLPIYHMLGNVSEWLNEENEAIGGNFLNTYHQSKKELSSSFKVNSPSPTIGFRIVMEKVLVK